MNPTPAEDSSRVITKIIPQKRSPNRQSIFLNDRFAFGLNVNVIARFRLHIGQSLTAAEVDHIEQGEVRQECFDKAMRFLQSRLHSQTELRRKLQRSEFVESIIDNVLADLQRLGYLDDSRYAQTRVLSGAQHKGHGPRRAWVELMKSGVGAEVAKKAIGDVYETHDSQAVARKLAQRQAERLRKLEPGTARRRLAGMLQRRGFDYETIAPVIDEVLGR